MTIQQAATVADTQGGRTTPWSTLATVWASVVPWETQQDEALRAGGAVSPTTRYRVQIRYRTDVTPQMRVSWTQYLAATATVLEVQAVSPRGREFLMLDCVVAAHA